MGDGDMVYDATISLSVDVTDDGETVLVDGSCGSCLDCAAGASLRCSAPLSDGRRFPTPVRAASAQELLASVLTVAALAEAPEVTTVVVVETDPSLLSVLVRATSRARVLVTGDLTDAGLRAELADAEPSGRARVVVAGADARAAVKAVRRGGHVCVGRTDVVMPSITELVQREVTLVGPRDAAAVLDRITADDWAAAAAAAPTTG